MPSASSNLSPVIVGAFAVSRSRSAAASRLPCILAVDDNRAQLALVTALIDQWGYTSLEARDGEEALFTLRQQAHMIDTIVLDRTMPGLNGMELVQRMNAEADLMGIPVIMLTGSSTSTHLQEEINAGVFYHVPKPVDPDLLNSVIQAALREGKQKRLLIDEIHRHSGALRNITQCRLQAQSLKDAENIACMLATSLPDPMRAITGLIELLVNAIEHGNLGISSTEKSKLMADGTWHDEIDRRIKLPEFASRFVEIDYQRKADGWVIRIADQGPGFDWKKYWHIDPAHATNHHGRGIPRARMLAFENINYNDKGNQVTISIHAESKPALKWRGA